MSSNDFYGLTQQFLYQFTREDAEQMSKCRIIQNNLVHAQGFPDSIADQSLLAQNEYFGQFGHILKLVLVKKIDKNNKKQTNSAYITYSTSKEAAYAVLSIDSITIDGHYVRAFFGTSKYCIHFLNNIECYNKDKCLFIHHIARPEDIIGTSNFGYAEHLNLAREICAISQSDAQRNMINFTFDMLDNDNNNYNANSNAVLNNVQSIITMEDGLNTSISSPLSNLTRTNTCNSYESINVKKYNSNNHSNQTLFKSKDKSRFFHNESYTNNNNINNTQLNLIPSYVLNLIDELALRCSFFNHFSKKEFSIEKFEKDYCKAKYQNYTKDSWFDFIFSQ